MFTLVFNNLITQLPGGTHTFVLSARDEMGHEHFANDFYYCQFANHDSSGSRIGGVGTFATLRGYVKNASEEDKASIGSNIGNPRNNNLERCCR